MEPAKRPHYKDSKAKTKSFPFILGPQLEAEDDNLSITSLSSSRHSRNPPRSSVQEASPDFELYLKSSFSRPESPDFAIQEQLLMLQREIQEMNTKLCNNEKHLDEKKVENQHLQDLVITLQHKIEMKKAQKSEKKVKSGCCNDAACIVF